MHLTLTQRVVGSNPTSSAITTKLHLAVVVEWYTQQIQNLPPERACEFESHPRHQTIIGALMENSNAELRWLPNSVLKQVPYLPAVEVIENEIAEYSGYYHIPDNQYPKGLIHIIASNDNCIEATIAHEFRHHWQMFNGDLHPANTLSLFSLDHLSYEEQIYYYFSKQPAELDALYFERKVTPSEYQRYWIECIMTQGKPCPR